MILCVFLNLFVTIMLFSFLKVILIQFVLAGIFLARVSNMLLKNKGRVNLTSASSFVYQALPWLFYCFHLCLKICSFGDIKRY